MNRPASHCEPLVFAAATDSRRVLVVGEGAFHGVLLDALATQRCQVQRCADLHGVQAAHLERASLVFLFASMGCAQALSEQVRSWLLRYPRLTLIPVVDYADQEKAALLLEGGCVDYLLSPFSEQQVATLLQRQALADSSADELVCHSASGRRLLAMAQRVALTRAPVLISGETGTGKERMARYIHRCSGRPEAPFVAVNCAAIPESMLESILFGHERGAFTGAVSAQAGKFEQANGGTLLLDEIGELPLALQAKLLRVLQEQRVERLGGRREIALDVRIIAATNRDLQQEVAAGRFRADLMFRLDVLPLHIAPLRERRDDILPLVSRFIASHAPGEGEELLTDSARRALLGHDWPGNVRELENTVQRALVLRNGLFIQPGDLGLEVPGSVPAASIHIAAAMQPDAGEDGRAALRASGKWAEYQHVLDTIRRFDGHKTKAAQSLGMSTRALRYRLSAMREQGVHIPF